MRLPSSTRRQIVGLLLVGITSCGLTAEEAGRRASTGAAASVQEHVTTLEPSEPGPAFERAGRGVAKGALAQLSSPAEIAQLRLVAREAAAAALRGIASADGPDRESVIASISDQAARGAAQAMTRELGPDGDGPLGQSIHATVERVSASVVRGLKGEGRLFPECTGADRQRCIDTRLEGMSRAAARGVRDGLRGLIALPALLLSFLLGAGLALAISWARWHHHPSGR